MLGVNVIGLNTYYAGLRREQQLYYFLLGNGATRNEAIAPFVRQVLIEHRSMYSYVRLSIDRCTATYV